MDRNENKRAQRLKITKRELILENGRTEKETDQKRSETSDWIGIYVMRMRPFWDRCFQLSTAQFVFGIVSWYCAHLFYVSENTFRKMRVLVQKKESRFLLSCNRYPLQLTIGVLIGAGFIFISLGVMGWRNYFQKIENWNLAEIENTIPEWMAMEHKTFSLLIIQYRVFVKLEQLFGMIGLLLAVLRRRISKAWTYFGVAIMAETAIMWIMDSYFLSIASAYVLSIQEAAPSMGFQNLIEKSLLRI